MIIRHLKVFDSSTISAIFYSEAIELCLVWYKSSPLPYAYSSCPVAVFKELITSDSVGAAASTLLKKSLTIPCRQLNEVEFKEFKRVMSARLS